MIKRIFSVLIIALMCFAFISFPEYKADAAQEYKIYSQATINDEFADDRVLVVLNEEYLDKNYSENDFAAIDCVNLTKYDFDGRNGVLRIDLEEKSKSNVLSISEELLNRDDVLYAGPDFRISLCSTESNDTFNDYQWALDSIGLQDAWGVSTGTTDVLVGIADSGIDGTHPDLSSSIVRPLCRDFTGDVEVSTPNPVDPLGHGTHVAGIVGAIGNNNVGVTGTNWNVGLVSLRVFDEYGSGYSSNLIKAISYANEHDISVLNFSGRWLDGDPGYNVALNSSIQNYDGIIICASGNDRINIDEHNVYPATIDLPNIISVGSINEMDERSDFSNYGSATVDIYAPGSEILSTIPTGFCLEHNVEFADGTRLCELSSINIAILNDYVDSGILTWDRIANDFEELFGFSPSNIIACPHEEMGYHYMSGTSMATPYVTGVAALLLSLDEELTTVQLKQAILQSAENINITIPDGSTQNVKKLNAYNAVKYVLSNYSETMTLGTTAQSLSQYVDSSSTFFDEKNYFAKLDVDDSLKCNFTVSSTSPLEITLYDSNFNEMDISINQTNGGATNSFVQQLPIGEYYLKVNFTNENASGTIATTIACEHFHNPLLWMYLNSSFHRGRCSCGEWIQKAHVIDASQVVNFKAPCLECHALLDLRDDSVGGQLGIGKESANGSYILPNGVIVLVEEDIDAYFAGTLIFYDGDSDLLTQ